jgi:glycosyltransferase involved in cell wall biosynthesis
VEADTDAFTGALREALETDARSLKEMGARGQSIGKNYAPEVIAAQLVSVYEWLLGRGDRPGCVRVD